MNTNEEFILPNKWCIRYNGEPEIEDYILSKKDYNHDYEVKLNEWVISEPGTYGSYQCRIRYGSPHGYTVISFSQFKEYVLGEKGNPWSFSLKVTPEMMHPLGSAIEEIKYSDEISGSFTKPKKIIGYKLIKPEYKEAVKCIINHDWFINFYINMTEKGYNFASMDKNDPSYWMSINSKIEQSGVLDIWFDPVYESSTEQKIIDYLAKKGITIGNLYAEDIVKLVNENENR